MASSASAAPLIPTRLQWNTLICIIILNAYQGIVGANITLKTFNKFNHLKMSSIKYYILFFKFFKYYILLVK